MTVALGALATLYEGSGHEPEPGHPGGHHAQRDILEEAFPASEAADGNGSGGEPAAEPAEA